MKYEVEILVNTYLFEFGFLTTGQTLEVPFRTAHRWVEWGIARALDDLPDIEDANILMMVVEHGSDATAPRPADAAAVYWKGEAEPENATDGDLWVGGGEDDGAED